MSLSNQKLTRLPHLPANTRKIDASFNKLSELNGDVLAELASELRSLDLSGNQLTELPHEIGHLTNLRELTLNGNRLVGIAAEIGNLRNLQVLSASNNQIAALPRHIGRCRALSELRLDGNRLTQVLLDLGELRQLQVLDLSSCALKQLPEQICYCASLIELFLGNNRLSALPVSIGRLTRLTVLDVSQNQLHDLPLSIGRCVGLDSVGARLDIAGNPLTNATLIAKAELGTDHLFRFLANRMSAVGDVELFTMKKSTITRKGHTIKMTTRDPAARGKKARRPPVAAQQHDEARRRDDDIESKRRRLCAAAQAVCADEILPTLSAAKKRAASGSRDEVVAVAHLAKAIQPEVRDAFELVSLPFIPHTPSAKSADETEDDKFVRLRAATDALLFDALSAVKALQKHIDDESLENEHRMRCVQTVRNIRSLLPGDLLVSRDSGRGRPGGSVSNSNNGSRNRSTAVLVVAGLASLCAIGAIVVQFAVPQSTDDASGIGVVLGLAILGLLSAIVSVLLRRFLFGVALAGLALLFAVAAIVCVALFKSGTV
jgi:hypothetical protein